MKGLLTPGAEVKEAAEARARGPLSLGRMVRRRAAALAGTQGFVLLQTAGSLDGEWKLWFHLCNVGSQSPTRISEHILKLHTSENTNLLLHSR